MEFLTFERVEGNRVVFKSDEGGERSFEIRTGREGHMYTAYFAPEEDFSFTTGRELIFAHPRHVRSKIDAEDAIRNLLIRCEEHGDVIYNAPEEAEER